MDNSDKLDYIIVDGDSGRSPYLAANSQSQKREITGVLIKRRRGGLGIQPLNLLREKGGREMNKKLIVGLVLMGLGGLIGIIGLANLTGLTFALGVYHPKPAISLLVYLGGVGLTLFGLRLWVSNENKNT